MGPPLLPPDAAVLPANGTKTQAAASLSYHGFSLWTHAASAAASVCCRDAAALCPKQTPTCVSRTLPAAAPPNPLLAAAHNAARKQRPCNQPTPKQPTAKKRAHLTVLGLQQLAQPAHLLLQLTLLSQQQVVLRLEQLQTLLSAGARQARGVEPGSDRSKGHPVMVWVTGLMSAVQASPVSEAQPTAANPAPARSRPPPTSLR